MFKSDLRLKDIFNNTETLSKRIKGEFKREDTAINNA